MMNIIGSLRFTWRVIVPVSKRETKWAMQLKKFGYKILKPKTAYDSDYYDSVVEGPAVRSADVIAESIMASLHPNTIVDIGCGTGALLESFRRKRCTVFGLEYSDAALEYCRMRELEVKKFDVRKDTIDLKDHFDVAISMEVAEHIPAKNADRYIALLTSLSNTIIFTAAHPGQGGTDHLNEQPPSYWKAKFRKFGFVFDEMLSLQLQKVWEDSGSVMIWYCQNLMVFVEGNVNN
jgi:SAM-dependent methyltransferase